MSVRATKGEQSYQLRSRGLRWKQVAAQIGGSASAATMSARHHAIHNGLPWPIHVPQPPRTTRMPRQVEFICDHCRRASAKRTGDVNRARRAGYALYCGKACSAAARSTNKTPEQRRREKRAYDQARRDDPETAGPLREAKRASYYRHHGANLERMAQRRQAIREDPEALAATRQWLAEYRARPEWKAHKRAYDRHYRALKEYGDPEMAEVLTLIGELEDIARGAEPSRFIRNMSKGRIPGRQQRLRAAGVQL